MLICLFTSAIMCLDMSFLESMKSSCLTSDKFTRNHSPVFTLKPLLFVPKPSAGTYYTIFDDYLVQQEQLCFDNETGEPCPGSQVNGYLYDIRTSLMHGVVDERAFLWFMRRFLYYYDNTVNSGSDMTTPTGSVLNIPATYARIPFDAQKVYCCFVNAIYNPDVLQIFELFIAQATQEIQNLLITELSKIKISDKQSSVVCLPIRFVYLKTLNELAAFFQSLIECVKAAIAKFNLADTLCYRVVNLKTKNMVPGAPFVNTIITPISGPVPPPISSKSGVSPSGKASLKKPTSADKTEEGTSTETNKDDLAPPDTDPVKPEDKTEPLSGYSDLFTGEGTQENSGEAQNENDEENAVLETIVDQEGGATSEEESTATTEPEDEDDLTEEEVEDFLENPTQTDTSGNTEETEAGSYQSFLSTFATLGHSDYSKIFSKDPSQTGVTSIASSKIPLKKVATFCSSSHKNKCSPGSYTTSSSPLCPSGSSFPSSSPCFPSSNLGNKLCPEGKFIVNQLLSGQSQGLFGGSNPMVQPFNPVYN